jgi:hypothetical protein
MLSRMGQRWPVGVNYERKWKKTITKLKMPGVFDLDRLLNSGFPHEHRLPFTFHLRFCSKDNWILCGKSTIMNRQGANALKIHMDEVFKVWRVPS